MGPTAEALGYLSVRMRRLTHSDALVWLVLPSVGFAGGVLLLLGVIEVFEEVGVEDGGGDFVVAGGPLAEVDGSAALGAEGDFGGVEGDEFFADGAVEGFGHDIFYINRVEDNLLRRFAAFFG